MVTFSLLVQFVAGVGGVEVVGGGGEEMKHWTDQRITPNS